MSGNLGVTHYADEGDGIVIDGDVIGPLPSLCGDGDDGDFMTFFVDQVTCRHCKALLR